MLRSRSPLTECFGSWGETLVLGLAGLKNLTDLYLHPSLVRAETLRVLRDNMLLDRVSIHQGRGAITANVTPSEGGVSLDLNNGEDIANPSMKLLTGLKKLRVLNLSQCSVNDDGLRALAGLNTITDLDLSFTGVSDAGLKHLKGLTRLSKLDLSETKVTDEGVKELQKALPNCKISR